MKRDPVINWPITRERYRQVLLKMHRHWREIQRLKAEIEQLRGATPALPEERVAAALRFSGLDISQKIGMGRAMSQGKYEGFLAGLKYAEEHPSARFRDMENLLEEIQKQTYFLGDAHLGVKDALSCYEDLAKHFFGLQNRARSFLKKVRKSNG